MTPAPASFPRGSEQRKRPCPGVTATAADPRPQPRLHVTPRLPAAPLPTNLPPLSRAGRVPSGVPPGPGQSSDRGSVLALPGLPALPGLLLKPCPPSALPCSPHPRPLRSLLPPPASSPGPFQGLCPWSPGADQIVYKHMGRGGSLLVCCGVTVCYKEGGGLEKKKTPVNVTWFMASLPLLFSSPSAPRLWVVSSVNTNSTPLSMLTTHPFASLHQPHLLLAK